MPQLARTPQELSAANVAHSAMDNLGFLGGSILGRCPARDDLGRVRLRGRRGRGAAAALALATMSRDRRPEYAGRRRRGRRRPADDGRLPRARSDPPLRLLGARLTLLVFVEGAADVLIVIIALDLLGLGGLERRLPERRLGDRRAGRRRRRSRCCVDRGQLVAGLVARQPDHRRGDRAAGRLAGGAGRLRRLVRDRHRLHVRRGRRQHPAAATRRRRDCSPACAARSRPRDWPAMALGAITVTGLVELLGIRGAGARGRRRPAVVRAPALGPAALASRSAPRSPSATSRSCAPTRSSPRCRWRPSSASPTTWSRSRSRPA